MINGLSNEYVNEICQSFFGKSFLGVFPCDIHPKPRSKKFSLIFNTGDSSTSGEHFVAIYYNKKSIFYFDSFGLPPNDQNIIKFLSFYRQGKKLISWKKRIQDSNSSFCGFYCIGFLLHKYKDDKKFPKIFHTKNLKLNDEKIVKFILDFRRVQIIQKCLSQIVV